jgi:hypothetical protein
LWITDAPGWVRLAGGDAEKPAVPPTEVIPAYEPLMRARYHLKRRQQGPFAATWKTVRKTYEWDDMMVEVRGAIVDCARISGSAGRTPGQ